MQEPDMSTVYNADDDFQTTISALEKGLQVQHIATFPFEECKYGDDIEVVLTTEHLLSFDQIPVRHGSSIVGIVERENSLSQRGTVETYMTRLDDSVLSAAETPLMDFITNEALYRLVLRGSKIEGIITKSDLIKLPVRLLAFSLVTHVEALLNRIIRATGEKEEILLSYLLSGRQKDIAKSLRKLKVQKRELDPLELTYLSDKRMIVSNLKIFEEEQLVELKELNELRNTIAHQKNYTESEKLVQDFIEQLRLAPKWIKLLSEKEAELLKK
jgi:predicted transcriptional regulator